jgi:hypothetical protein
LLYKTNDLSYAMAVIRRTEILIALLAVAVWCLLLFGVTLGAQLNFIDDHEWIRFSSATSVHPQLQSVTSVWDYMDYDGRFRPVHFVIRIGGSQLWGANPAIWHGISILCAIITSWTVYVATRRLKTPVYIAVLNVVWLTATGSAAEIWARPGPSEPFGIVFTSLAALAFVVAAQCTHEHPRLVWQDAAGIGLLLLAGLTKESFVLVLPALLLGRYLIAVLGSDSRQWRKQGVALVPLFIISGVLMLGLLAIMLSQITGYGQSVAGGRVSERLDVLRWYREIVELAPIATMYFPIIAMAILAALPGKMLPRYAVTSTIILALVWAIPQFALYTSGLANSRFSYPLIAGIAAFNVFCIIMIVRRGHLWAARAIALLAGVLTVTAVVDTI